MKVSLCFNYVRCSPAPNMVRPADDKSTADCNTDKVIWKYVKKQVHMQPVLCKTKTTQFLDLVKLGKTGVMCHSNRDLLRKYNSSKENIFSWINNMSNEITGGCKSCVRV